jgi:putative membrane protein
MIVQRGLKLPLLLAQLGPILLTLLLYDIVVTVAFTVGHVGWLGMDNLPLPLLGSAIALVVTLRNNLAYARWWEARTLWGAVVNESRNLVRGLVALLDDATLRGILARHQLAYAKALRCHLLRLPPWAEIAGDLPEPAMSRLRKAANVPAAIQREIATRLGACRSEGVLDTVSVAALNATLGALANAQGGLERIKNTPLPRQYNQFPLVFTRIYCLLIPLGLVRDMGYVTPLGSTLIGFMFLALDRIGRDLEDPFEGKVHDVPMQAIVRTIEIDLLQMVGEADVAAAIPVEDGVLR